MTSVPSCLSLTAALTKGQNNIQVGNYTYIVHASQAEKQDGAISRHVFVWQKCFQYSAKMFAVVFQNQ